jgi:TRAP transporter 4TM/12TM fusion protein
MDEQAQVATEQSVPAKGVSDRVLTALFWLNLVALIVIHFSQFRTFLWTAWDPPAFAFTAAHVTAAGFMVVLWTLHKGSSVPSWVMGGLMIVGFTITGYYLHTHALEMSFRSAFGSMPDVILGGVLFTQILYLSWRYWGPIFPILGIFFIGYAFIANDLSGPLHGPELDAHQISTRVAHHMFGGIANIAARFLWLLIFWGLLLSTAGGGIALAGLARLLSGMSGGPAIGSLLASAVAGSFVGAGTSNVAITGSITIPGMRKAGYTAPQAGAVEAIASNASSITPPVLGAVAFVMMNILRVNYLDVIAMSIIPAVLWFLTVGFYLYAHAHKNRETIKSLEVEPGTVNRSLYTRSAILLAVPMAVMIYFVLQGYSVRMGGLGAFLTTVVLALVLRVETSWSVWSDGLRKAAFNASAVTLVLVVGSIVADVITLTGVGGRMGEIVETVSRGNLMLAGLIMICFGVVLGAALPALAIYLIVAVTFAPVFTKMGVDVRVSHYTAFYIGTLSAIIPPVAASALVAAAIANTTYLKVCVEVAKMSWPLWVAPLLFLVAPELLLRGDSNVVTTMLVISSSAVVLLGVQAATAGWLLRPLTPLVRVALYANFGFLVVALNEHSELLMTISLVIVVALAVLNMVLTARALERLVGAAAPSESGGTGD